MTDFNRRTLEEQTDALARYLPGGDIFASKFIAQTNLRKFLAGLSVENRRADGYILEVVNEYIPDTTSKFISEWEAAVGIPDDCFSGEGPLEERRRNVLVKLAASGVQTVDDFIELGSIYGYTLTVYPLSSRAFPPYNVPFVPVGLPEARFILVFEGENLINGVPPYDVPFNLIVGETELQCILKKLVPANVKPIFINSN